jgi:hypothetical protein
MGMTVMGFFFRNNIHPYLECLKREDTLKQYARSIDLKMIYQPGYDIEAFFQSIAFRESDRCRYCYFERLNTTAMFARKGKFDAFSSSLLYSKFQNHALIRETGEAAAKKHGVKFFYHDFREGWKTGIEESKALNLYRQQYCGCIYSEKARYFNP